MYVYTQKSVLTIISDTIFKPLNSLFIISAIKYNSMSLVERKMQGLCK